MNREITQRPLKFRCWNGEQMVSPDWIGRDGYGHWTENSIPTSSNKLMQFTGLRDKNGKEIYEGDILKVITKSLPLGKDANGYTFFGVVKFDYGEYIISFKEKFGFLNSLKNWALNHSEIIGNLFEHPNLLTPKIDNN